MRVDQCLDRCANFQVFSPQFAPVLVDAFQHANRANMGICVCERSILTLPASLKAARLVIAEAPGAAGEHGGLDAFQM
mgnify:CR=1 FL=1